MLTPVFYCEQDDDFVIVRLILSGICKIANAAFDINGNQFTFHCSPYYLRLRFDQGLQEGKGERATYDLESNTLTVWLPKDVKGEVFAQLDNPGYLIATEKERKQLITVLNSVDAADSTENDANDGACEDKGPVDIVEAEETEYVQKLQNTASLEQVAVDSIHYGFANHFSGLFSHLDVDLVREMVSLPAPETTLPQERHRLRLETENNNFDEEVLLLDFEDEDGDIARLLRYVPSHIRDFQTALQAVEVKEDVACTNQRAPATEVYEEECEAVVGCGLFEVWSGNVADFKPPELPAEDEVAVLPIATASSSPSNHGATPPAVAEEEVVKVGPGSTTQSISPGVQIAIPRCRPVLRLTKDEQDAITRIKPPKLLFPPPFLSVAALTADLLFTEAYDDLVTEGTGCSESLWNLCMLSPALSFLDPPEDLYDACVSFARRALIYPLRRHFALVQRVFAVVGTRLLLGRTYVIRALLRVRDVLAHAEHKHILNMIFVDPLVGYWMNITNADDRFTEIALEIHAHSTLAEPLEVKIPASSNRGGALPLSGLLQDGKKTLRPLTLLNLGLPL
ncbi:unnamed protein product [Phytomonas sp. EM1]|nr:unnamed protein product [Phytomonas sp. EM1]|eukprot:CCW60283.1 unnamed protein product [Phytomonas sp. isolate EM1]